MRHRRIFIRVLATSTLISVCVTSPGCLPVQAIRKGFDVAQAALEQVESGLEEEESVSTLPSPAGALPEWLKGTPALDDVEQIEPDG